MVLGEPVAVIAIRFAGLRQRDGLADGDIRADAAARRGLVEDGKFHDAIYSLIIGQRNGPHALKNCGSAAS